MLADLIIVGLLSAASVNTLNRLLTEEARFTVTSGQVTMVTREMLMGARWTYRVPVQECLPPLVISHVPDGKWRKIQILHLHFLRRCLPAARGDFKPGESG